MNYDLPHGYRWATEEETEKHSANSDDVPGAIMVARTTDSTGKPYTQGEADLAVPYNWRTKDFRIIRGEGGNYKCQYYSTKEKRDAAAAKFAEKDGTDVATELWDKDHPQDDLNQGWGCDGVARAPITLDLKIENYYDGDKVVTRPTITIPYPPNEADDPDGYDEWLNGDDSIFEATGTGRTEGDSAYFVEVVGSTRPDVIPVGTEYEFGL